MVSPDDPAEMTAEQRFEEVAAIIARGLLRLQPPAHMSASSEPSEICERLLDDAPPVRTDGRTG